MTAQTLASSPGDASPQDDSDWRVALTGAFRQGGDLLAYLGLERSLADSEAARSFACLVPRHYARRMRHADPADPLLRQVLPVSQECEDVPGFSSDPLQEADAQCGPGLLQKYQNRALLVCTGACAVHCRYCFRRHYDYSQTPGGRRWWQPALEEIRHQPQVDEVILSGGDPLLLSDDSLAALLQDLTALPQLKRLRMHSRLPVVLPQRVSDSLLDICSRQSLPLVMVIHANHAREFDDDVTAACQRLRAAGVHMLNQSVLLAGVNDSVDALADVSHALFAAGVLPYYLHMLDPVAGTAHFALSDERAQELMRSLQSQLPGYLLPRLAREVPGADSKQIISFS